MNEILTQAILEKLAERAKEFSDAFKPKENRVQIRCSNSDNHRNGDAHNSAWHHFGKYVVRPLRGFKEGEDKLADRLDVGVVEGGLTLLVLAKAKGLPVDFLQKWGWRTQRGKDGLAKVLIPWYGEAGVVKHAPAYHIRHYISKDDDVGPRFTWDQPKGIELLPYGVWRFQEFLDTAESIAISPYIVITESEIDCLTCWLRPRSGQSSRPLRPGSVRAWYW